MYKHSLLLTSGIVCILMAGSSIAVASAGEQESVIPGQYIVVLKDSVTDVDAVESDLLARSGAQRLDSYRSAIHGFSARLSAVGLSRIESDPRVAFVSEDHVVSIADGERVARGDRTALTEADAHTSRGDTDAAARDRGRGGGTTPPPPPPQQVPTGIARIGALALANSGAGVNVAVVDTGIDTSHPDLSTQMAGGYNCTTSNRSDFKDYNGHGTHVAGTIAAADNSLGVVGVAPEAKLWAVRVLGKNGSGTWSSVICGLDFVTSRAPQNGGPITVANMSLGGGGLSDNNCGLSNNDALHRAICRARDAGVTIVVAAGNSGASASAFVPAAYNDAVITVSALADSDGLSGGFGNTTSYGADDTFASFSNFGSPVDIGAPGVNIYSTWLGGGYKYLSGTSMATPHVGGAVALFLASHPGAAWTQVKDALAAQGEQNNVGHFDPSGLHPEPVLRVDML